jgi:thiamine-phosphate pyrophosphorylase
MFIFKKKYFLIIASITDLDLNKIKANNKFIIIYRNSNILDKVDDLRKFRNKCKLKKFKFYVANNIKLCFLLKTDGIYISAHNKTLRTNHLKNYKFDIIGSAHNILEINLKLKQGCSSIIVSKLFKVDYAPNSNILGIIKFHHLLNFNKNLIPLGGIKSNNLNKLRNVNSEGIALFSEIKKKPAISNRLF